MSEKYKMTVNIDLGRDIVFGKMCSALGVSKTERINFLISQDLEIHEKLCRELSDAFPNFSMDAKGIRERGLG
jgi:hypothetical protein|tara:strand:- start:680 stop:898 length:219 start_codon:yes stop_codon:yes gene_type:complete